MISPRSCFSSCFYLLHELLPVVSWIQNGHCFPYALLTVIQLIACSVLNGVCVSVSDVDSLGQNVSGWTKKTVF